MNVSRQHLQILDTVRAAVCQRNDVINVIPNHFRNSEKNWRIVLMYNKYKVRRAPLRVALLSVLVYLRVAPG